MLYISDLIKFCKTLPRIVIIFLMSFDTNVLHVNIFSELRIRYLHFIKRCFRYEHFQHKYQITALFNFSQFRNVGSDKAPAQKYQSSLSRQHISYYKR